MADTLPKRRSESLPVQVMRAPSGYLPLPRIMASLREELSVATPNQRTCRADADTPSDVAAPYEASREQPPAARKRGLPPAATQHSDNYSYLVESGEDEEEDVDKGGAVDWPSKRLCGVRAIVPANNDCGSDGRVAPSALDRAGCCLENSKSKKRRLSVHLCRPGVLHVLAE